MLRRLFRWLFRWLFPSTLRILLRKATVLGRVNLQQCVHAQGLGWFCAIRSMGEKHYSWTGNGMTMEEALEEALENAHDYAIGAAPVIPHAPRLGGSDNDG